MIHALLVGGALLALERLSRSRANARTVRLLHGTPLEENVQSILRGGFSDDPEVAVTSYDEPPAFEERDLQPYGGVYLTASFQKANKHSFGRERVLVVDVPFSEDLYPDEDEIARIFIGHATDGGPSSIWELFEGGDPVNFREDFVREHLESLTGSPPPEDLLAASCRFFAGLSMEIGNSEWEITEAMSEGYLPEDALDFWYEVKERGHELCVSAADDPAMRKLLPYVQDVRWVGPVEDLVVIGRYPDVLPRELLPKWRAATRGNFLPDMGYLAWLPGL